MVDITEQSSRRRMIGQTACAMAVALGLCAEVRASGAPAGAHGDGAGGEHDAASAPFDPTLPRPLDLGSFNLRNFRPTHNEIASIKFTLCVVFPAGTSDAEIAELETWKRRLRDQAITAVRSASPEDLSDPKLVKVRRLLLLRLKRMSLPKEVEAVYLTDFAITSG